jgi:metal-responsive CopG/Arc/MetJ family transcriptional regulator
MKTHTIKVTGIPDDLLRLLDERLRRNGGDRAAFVRELIRKELQPPAEEPRPHSGISFEEILAPVHQQVAESGITDEELDRLFEETREQVREEKRTAQSQ